MKTQTPPKTESELALAGYLLGAIRDLEDFRRALDARIARGLEGADWADVGDMAEFRRLLREAQNHLPETE